VRYSAIINYILIFKIAVGFGVDASCLVFVDEAEKTNN
jgi:hypothetical protein